MAYSSLEQKLVNNYLDVNYPQPEPEPEPEQSMDGVQLAAGPGGTVSDAGAAFGIYPGMGKRSQRSDIGERMVTGAPDFAAGAVRGAATSALGFGGDIQKIGRFITALATDNQGGSIMDRLGRAAQTMEDPTFLPSSEDVSKGGYTIPGTSITLPGLPAAVPAGTSAFGMTPEQRQAAAEAGQVAGELVGDPVLLAKGGQMAVQAGKGIGRMAGQELNRAMIDGAGPLARAVPKSARPLGMVGNDVSYRSSHAAPSREFGATLDDLTGIYPADVYSKQGPRIYNTGMPYDKKAFEIAFKAKGNPDAEVTIYRAVPSEVKSEDINRGDWVAITKEYARDHGESVLRGDYKIITKKVKARDIYTNGDSIQEWGYDPAEKGTK